MVSSSLESESSHSSSSLSCSTGARTGEAVPPTFAVPAIPSKRARPLSLSTLHNQITSPLSHVPFMLDSDAGPSGRSRLKRLSLVSRPTHKHDVDTSSTALATPGTPGTPGTPSGRRRAVGMRSSISYSPAVASSQHRRTQDESVDGGFESWKMERRLSEETTTAGPSRSSLMDRRRSTALILQRPRSIAEDGQDGPDEHSTTAQRNSDLEGKGKEEAGKHRRGETLVEKHADLLTLIAQKERRVNDLRQELASQEASLAQLKGRWTAIVSRSAPSASPRINSTRSSRGHPLSGGSARGTPVPGIARPTPIESALQALTASTSSTTSPATSSTGGAPSTTPAPPAMSTSTSASSHLSALHTPTNDLLDPTLTFDGELALTPRDSQSLAAFLQTLSLGTTPESLLGQETIEGGKRFWSQLVKTVSAAAGGTVPGAEGEGAGENPLSPRLDISALKSILPSWTSVPAQPAPPRRPVNASRLPKNKGKRSKTSLRASTASPGSSPHSTSGPGKDQGFGEITPSPSVSSAASRASLSSGAGVDLLGDDVDTSLDDGMGDLEAPSLKPSKSSERTPATPLSSAHESQGDEEEGDYNWGW